MFNNGPALTLPLRAQLQAPPPQRMDTLPFVQLQSASAPAPVSASNSGQRHQSFRSFQPQRPITPPPRLAMTADAVQLMFELHNGEMEFFQPLDGEELDVLTRELVAAAQSHFGEAVTVPPRLAYSVLETARYLPGANGWPTIENAMHYCAAQKAPAVFFIRPAENACSGVSKPWGWCD